MTEIEVRACIDTGGNVEHVIINENCFFGVYIGMPGEFRWVADFDNIHHALQWAKYTAQRCGYEFHDRIKYAG